MRILLTGSRAPVTLELIRVLAAAGNEVLATDSFAPTLGSHSRWLTRHFVLPPPRHSPREFGEALARLAAAERIDWVIPTCEEVFHVGRHHARLSAHTRLLCPPLEELDGWHNKFLFQQRAMSLGLYTPRTELVQSQAELHAALGRFPRYLLKPAYSRFAARIITNQGRAAGRSPLAACQPSPAEPWLVQEFVEGEAECGYTVAHHGRVTLHCSYRTPHRLNAGAGVSFLAVEGGPLLALARRLLEGTTFTGQFSLDALRTPEGRYYLLECNPRATSGVHLIRPDALARGLLDPDAEPWVEPAGNCQQLLFVVLARGPWRLLSDPPLSWWRDVVLRPGDPLPALTQLLQLVRFWRMARRHRRSLVEATTEDIEWNGPLSP